MLVFKQNFKIIGILTVSLVMLALLSFALFAGEAGKKKNYIKVIYFHGENRCHTCLTIEQLSKEAMEEVFAIELKEGNLLWDVINYDEEKNAHYMDDFGLYAQALIIIRYKDGKQVEWKSLEKIWELVHEKEKFEKYVVRELKSYLKKING